jgi:hypothetical protein
MADVVWLRRDRRLPVVVVQDGAPELWGLMWTALRDAGIHTWHQAIDRFHVTERIAAVLAEVIRNPARRTAELEKWRCELERSNSAVRRFVDGVRDRVPRPEGLDADSRPLGLPVDGGHLRPNSLPHVSPHGFSDRERSDRRSLQIIDRRAMQAQRPAMAAGWPHRGTHAACHRAERPLRPHVAALRAKVQAGGSLTH